MRQNHTVGILLAGGLSRRYGTPKAFAEINGKKFYEIAYDILAELCQEVIIVTRPELKGKFPQDVRIMEDDERFFGCGPLAGIFSAMSAEIAKRYVVLPCDMPLLTKEIVEKLLLSHQSEVTVTIADGRKQPLVSVWNRSMFQKIEKTLMNEQYKMTEVFNLANVEYVEASSLTATPFVFLNINTPEEYQEAKKWNQKLC